MIAANETFTTMINSPVRTIKAKVELYEGSTLVNTFAYDGNLINFTVERVCEEGKFFGFGICQKVNVKVIDTKRELSITTANSLRIAYGVGDEWVYTHPTFNITQTRRDENTNELTIYGYDLLFAASAKTVADAPITAPYTIQEFAAAVGTFLGAASLSIKRLGDTETCFSTSYETGANFEGTETLRDALNDVAEATQTIYFVDASNNLVFKRLDKNAAADFTMSKSVYISLDSKDSRRLGTIASVTELGDNVSASMTESGSTQYVRDNPFWELREDIDQLVENALAAVGGLTINQFDCEWRGNPLLEIGDKIDLVTKDGNTVPTFFVDDSIEYNGGFSSKMSWTYNENDTESETNDTSLGDVLKQTYAKVDKANKKVEIVASQTEAMQQNISQLQMDTESVSASVQQVETNTNQAIGSINEDIEVMQKKVEAAMTSEQVQIAIEEKMQEGVESVTTSTGYTFDKNGLTIEKSGSEMKTQITEDGMKVFRDSQEVLVANNLGVEATNLHATTYLIIGTHSRFEDYGGRTGCFWIG